jgi:hypothetical protein
MTRERLSVQMKSDHVTDSSRLGVTVVVTAAESYDVLVGGAMLYPMGFQMDYWTEIATYRPGWHFGDGRMSQVPVRFIYGVRPGGSPLEVLASIAGFGGMVTWPGDLLEGNISAVDTPAYEDIEEVSSFVAAVSSSLDVPLWRSSGVLRQDADRLVSQAWREAFGACGGGGGSTTDSYFWSCWVVSVGYYTHCVGISFRGYLRVGSIWWD